MRWSSSARTLARSVCAAVRLVFAASSACLSAATLAETAVIAGIHCVESQHGKFLEEGEGVNVVSARIRPPKAAE